VNLAALIAVARRQHGCVTVTQARELGLSSARWKRLLREGLLVPQRRGVARLVGFEAAPMATITAAFLVAGLDAIVSHTSAALVWGAPVVGDDPVHLIIPSRRRSVRLDGVVVHSPRDLLDLTGVPRQGLRVANPLRVACDVGAVAPHDVVTVLEHFFVRGFVRPDAVRAALDRHSRQGRNGVGALRAALDAYPLGNKPPDSVLEPAMARLLSRHELPRATFHAIVAGWEVDFLVDRTPVVIECDGWSTHGLDREQFERDRRKDAELRALGFLVCRYTWRQVTRRPQWVAGNLRGVLQLHAPQVLA
jgi:very-short-patch-repair endonuclease